MIGAADSLAFYRTPNRGSILDSEFVSMTTVQSRQWLWAAAILLLVLLAYQPVWRAGFVWDDDVYVTENLALRSADGLQKIWSGETIQYYPLVFTSFWTEYHLWKLQPLGYHLVNLALHALNAVLLWRVLKQLTLPGAWLAAAIFAIHPVTVESVAWVTERKNVLSLMFYLLAALAFFRFRPLADDKSPGSKDWRLYWLSVALFVCAVLSKTVTCSLPAALLLVIWWKAGKITRRDILLTAPMFITGLALAVVTMHMERRAGAVGQDWLLSPIERCLVAGHALWFYAGKLVWPRSLTFIYPRWHIDGHAASQYAFPVAALMVIAALWSLRSRIGRGPLVAVLFFAGTLVPALGFFDVYPFLYSFVADHFQYVACIGLIALAVGAGTMLLHRVGGNARGVAVAISVALLAALSAATYTQAQAYRDLETLWRDTLSKNPECWMADNNLAIIVFKEGKCKEAISLCDRALQLKPDDPDILNTLAGALIQAGRFQDAIGYCQRAEQVAPRDSRAYNNLGLALDRLGRGTEAIASFDQALLINPNDATARRNLATAANNLAWTLATEGGDPGRALLLAKRACALTDNRVAAYMDTLAAAYASDGRFPDAITVAQNGLALAQSDGQPQVAQEIATHLELYRTGTPIRVSREKPSLN